MLTSSPSLLPRTTAPPDRGRKRKRRQDSDDEILSSPTGTTPPARLMSQEEVNPIEHWTTEGCWPKTYFEQDDQTREDFIHGFEKDWRFERNRAPQMSHLIPWKASSASSVRLVRSEDGSTVPLSSTQSGRRPREVKSAQYNHPAYETELADQGSFMDEDEDGPRTESKDLCWRLLGNDQDVPELSRFSDGVFKLTCRRIHNSNEAKVINAITRLIVPSAEHFADFGSQHLEHLVETVNEGWNNSIPVTGIRPQPDYAVGFGRSAFTNDQSHKLDVLTDDAGLETNSRTWYMATFFMYLPFLTCEVKCGAAALDVADRQNAHSMTLAVRGIVELFRLAECETEVDREILAFSVSHDNQRVRIYGHYPVIERTETKFYRYPIREFDFTALDGREKWTAYKFTKNLYDTWVPTHFKRLCSVIDKLPLDLDFDVPPLSEGSGIFQVFASHHRSRSNTDPASSPQEDDSQASLLGSQDATSNMSFSQPGLQDWTDETVIL